MIMFILKSTHLKQMEQLYDSLTKIRMESEDALTDDIRNLTYKLQAESAKVIEQSVTIAAMIEVAKQQEGEITLAQQRINDLLNDVAGGHGRADYSEIINRRLLACIANTNDKLRNLVGVFDDLRNKWESRPTGRVAPRIREDWLEAMSYRMTYVGDNMVSRVTQLHELPQTPESVITPPTPTV